ncbi:TPA: MepB family protein [Listeria innocua]|nr:MepB family protein [Listeria innocua]HCJ4344180.1 MepB family protein [Listeria innocua]HCJ4473982.1 MepB family protein [Listeria innocua]HCJ4503195.1 MepB family protein [Listeria innocua]HCJ4509640.1 MepB family protein [Listeria innocua]
MEYEQLLQSELGELEIIREELQNKEYRGMIVKTAKDDTTIRTRLAKKTNKKAGYFVAFWEKDEFGKNCPFNENDSADFLSIVVMDGDLNGLFVFPRECLIDKEILTSEAGIGKMAARFYPSWCQDLNKTAEKTQAWQQVYFKNYSIRKEDH